MGREQENRLTVATDAAVQQAIAAHAAATGQDRYKVEQAVKKLVRHPEPPADA
ncbi:hypothetical protein [Streptomyces sp. TE33382]